MAKMKPIAAKWIIDAAQYIYTHPVLICNGFHAPRITNAISEFSRFGMLYVITIFAFINTDYYFNFIIQLIIIIKSIAIQSTTINLYESLFWKWGDDKLLKIIKQMLVYTFLLVNYITRVFSMYD